MPGYFNLDAGLNGNNSQSFNTASTTPTSNRGQFLAVSTRLHSGSLGAPTVTGGAAWTHINGNQNTGTDGRIDVFKSIESSPSAHALNVNYGSGNVVKGLIWHWMEYDDVDTTDHVVQNVAAELDQSALFEITLASFADPTNNDPFLATMLHNDQKTMSAESPLVALNNQGQRAYQQLTCDGQGEDTTPGASYTPSANTDWGGVALEIKSGAAPPSVLGTHQTRVGRQTQVGRGMGRGR
jgi:hypothetical protein